MSRATNHNLLVLASLLSLAAFSPVFAEKARYRVDLEFLECHEESDEIGSDDPYAVMVAVNIRTGEIQQRTRCFQDVETGDTRRVDTGKGLVFDGWVDAPEECIVLVALLEFDRSFGTGYVIVDQQFPVNATAAVKNAVGACAQKHAQGYAQGVFSRAVVVNELRTAMLAAVNGARGGDDFLGFDAFDLTGPTTAVHTLRMTGDGSHYKLFFRQELLETYRATSVHAGKMLVAPPPPNLLKLVQRTVRIRVLDASSKAPLSVVARIIQNSKVVYEGNAPSSGWIETTLMDGKYLAQVGTQQNGYEIVTRNFEVAGKDVPLTILLTRLAGIPGGPTHPPAGKTRWVYDMAPHVWYQLAPGTTDRWQELESGQVKQSFRVISGPAGCLALRDEVRAIWLRLYTGKCEISEDGVNFKPWFGGRWQ